MGLASKIGDLFGFGATETFTYECDSCGGVFESTIPSRALVDCPECDGEDVTPVPGEK
jgi:Zn finger protein HypA/HybF involved in hydrogenase expression